MRLYMQISLLVLASTLFVLSEGRRIQVRPSSREEEEDDTIQYYAAEPQDDGQGVVYISSADQYNGLYGQQASSRSAADNYPIRQPLKSSSKVKESPKQPPIQTIRNYNKVNDDGSFTFGYEAADGSFKEETRGTDCVVRGKYGYIDPDGNKREFTYVSGNPCDPNAPKEEDIDERPDNSAEPENVPANYPTRPIRPIRPVTVAPKPAVTLFQNNYAENQEEEQPEPEQILRPTPQPRARPQYISRPQYVQPEESPIYSRPRVTSTTPSSILYKHSETPLTITPRPVTHTTPRPTLPPTTYRPQLLQVAVTPKSNSVYYTKQAVSPTLRPLNLNLINQKSFYTTPKPYFQSSPRTFIDFDAEFKKFQTENNLVSPTPKPHLIKTVSPKPQKSLNNPGLSGQVYSSELVYDPSTGQYNTQLFQTLPHSEGGEISLNQRIQPYVHQPQPQLVNIQQLQQQSPLYRPQPQRPSAAASQALYQQQQQELQFQNSQQLYAQQQRARAQQNQPHQPPTAPQQFYYIQPSAEGQSVLPGGQIDAFLRGHNINF